MQESFSTSTHQALSWTICILRWLTIARKMSDLAISAILRMFFAVFTADSAFVRLAVSRTAIDVLELI